MKQELKLNPKSIIVDADKKISSGTAFVANGAFFAGVATVPTAMGCDPKTVFTIASCATVMANVAVFTLMAVADSIVKVSADIKASVFGKRAQVVGKIGDNKYLLSNGDEIDATREMSLNDGEFRKGGQSNVEPLIPGDHLKYSKSIFGELQISEVGRLLLTENVNYPELRLRNMKEVYSKKDYKLNNVFETMAMNIEQLFTLPERLKLFRLYPNAFVRACRSGVKIAERNFKMNSSNGNGAGFIDSETLMQRGEEIAVKELQQKLLNKQAVR
jgi:hypothetical protein